MSKDAFNSKLDFIFQHPLFLCFTFVEKKRLSQLYLTIFLMLIAAFLEVVSVGSVVPLVASIIGSSMPNFISIILEFFSVDTMSAELNRPFGFQIIFTAFLLMVIISTIFRLVAQYGIIWFTNQLGFDLTNRSFLVVLNQDYQFHVDTNSSEILATINKVQSIMNGVISPVLQSISSSIIAIAIIAFLTILNWKIALITFLLMFLTYVAISYIVKKKLNLNSIIISKALSQRVKIVNEGLGNISQLILSDRVNNQYKLFVQNEVGFKVASVENGFISAAPKFIVEGIGILVLLLSAYFLTTMGSSTLDVLPTIAAFAFATQKLLPSLQTIFQAWSKISGNMKLIQDLLSILTLPTTYKSPSVNQCGEFKKVSFVDVCFKHSNGYEVLKDVNLEIIRGDVIGIVGETGSGKSTFVSILSHLISPTDGHLSVINQKGCEYSRAEWQSNIAYVPQNPFFLDESIINNISLEDDPKKIDIKKLRSAIKVSQLSKFISSLEYGLETGMGERGAKLSGGQLQRIAIARALYADKSLIILDEATSALDNLTETNLLQALMTESVGKTIIFITHRPEALKICTKIFKLTNKSLEKL